MIKLRCKLGTNIQIVEVQPRDKLYILLEKLSITDKNTKFLFKGQSYNMASILTFQEIGLIHDESIFIYNQGISGGGGMTFTDVSKKNTINLGFSSSAPSYRTARKGLNIFGICKKNDCKAYEKEVVAIISKNKVDIIEEKFSFLCPECNSIIVPKTVGFYLCKYHIYGKKLDGEKLVNFDGGHEEAEDKEHLRYFNPNSNGEAFFFKLIIEITGYY